MSLLKCSRTHDVQDLLMLGHWPEACSAELRAHVAGCRGCSQMVLLTQGMRQAREDSAQMARLEPAGLIWWRAQLRRRRAAMESVSRPMWQVPMFAVALSLLVAVAFLAWRSEQGGGWRAWLGGSLKTITSGLGMLPLVMGASALMLLGGLVVWLTLERE